MTWESLHRSYPHDLLCWAPRAGTTPSPTLWVADVLIAALCKHQSAVRVMVNLSVGPVVSGIPWLPRSYSFLTGVLKAGGALWCKKPGMISWNPRRSSKRQQGKPEGLSQV